MGYTNVAEATRPGDLCVLSIKFYPAAGPRISAPPWPNCENNGGARAELTPFQFSYRAYYGPVTDQLDFTERGFAEKPSPC